MIAFLGRLVAFILYLTVWFTVALAIWVFVTLRVTTAYSFKIFWLALFDNGQASDKEINAVTSFWYKGLLRSKTILFPELDKKDYEFPIQISSLTAILETLLLASTIAVLYFCSFMYHAAINTIPSWVNITNSLINRVEGLFYTSKEMENLIHLGLPEDSVFNLIDRSTDKKIFGPVDFRVDGSRIYFRKGDNSEESYVSHSALCTDSQALSPPPVNDFKVHYTYHSEPTEILNISGIFICTEDDYCTSTSNFFKYYICRDSSP